MFVESKVFPCRYTGTITITNPPVNALSEVVFNELNTTFDQMLKNETVRAIVLTGSGRFFCAGADIGMLSGFAKSGDEASMRAAFERFHEIFLRIDEASKPVIAAVNGFCLGGGLELALACDYIVAVPEAKFGFPEVGLGIIPGLGGTQRFPRRVGKTNAARYILSGQKFDADTAKNIGLVDRLSDGAVPSAMVLYQKVLSGTYQRKPDTLALSGIPLHSMNMGSGHPAFAIEEAYLALSLGTAIRDLRMALEMETDHFIACMLSRDGREGLAAFVEKRKPNFGRVILS